MQCGEWAGKLIYGEFYSTNIFRFAACSNQLLRHMIMIEGYDYAVDYKSAANIYSCLILLDNSKAPFIFENFRYAANKIDCITDLQYIVSRFKDAHDSVTAKNLIDIVKRQLDLSNSNINTFINSFDSLETDFKYCKDEGIRLCAIYSVL